MRKTIRLREDYKKTTAKLRLYRKIIGVLRDSVFPARAYASSLGIGYGKYGNMMVRSLSKTYGKYEKY